MEENIISKCRKKILPRQDEEEILEGRRYLYEQLLYSPTRKRTTSLGIPKILYKN